MVWPLVANTMKGSTTPAYTELSCLYPRMDSTLFVGVQWEVVDSAGGGRHEVWSKETEKQFEGDTARC